VVFHEPIENAFNQYETGYFTDNFLVILYDQTYASVGHYDDITIDFLADESVVYLKCYLSGTQMGAGYLIIVEINRNDCLSNNFRIDKTIIGSGSY
jgi:hypothetical protein